MVDGVRVRRMAFKPSVPAAWASQTRQGWTRVRAKRGWASDWIPLGALWWVASSGRAGQVPPYFRRAVGDLGVLGWAGFVGGEFGWRRVGRSGGVAPDLPLVRGLVWGVFRANFRSVGREMPARLKRRLSCSRDSGTALGSLR
jgi:hypothetical protein